MGLWHVFYADWQMECCGTPLSLGDEVSWPLLLRDADDVLGGGWHDQLTKIVGSVAGVPDEGRAVRVVREDTGLMVALHRGPVDRGPEADLGEMGPGDRIRSVGLLTAEFHSDGLPEVAGRVRAIQLLTQGWAETPGSLTREPVPAMRSLRSVRDCPKWFGDAVAGVIVTLEVPDTDSWLSYALRESRGLPHAGAEPGTETAGLTPGDLADLLATLSTVPPTRQTPHPSRRQAPARHPGRRTP